MKRFVLFILVVWFSCVGVAEISHAQDAVQGQVEIKADTSVGIEASYLLPWKGPELFAKPVNDRAVLLVRIADVKEDPEQVGTKVYDIRYIADMPGRYDLRKFLFDIDEKEVTELPSMPVVVTEVLPEKHDGALADLENMGLPEMGGYRKILYVLIGVWLIPIVLMFVRHYIRTRPEPIVPEPPAPTLADQLRPFIQNAQQGKLSPSQQAKLELLLIACWKQRLNIKSDSQWEVVQKLKAHEDAGSILRALEQWLHAPPAQRKIDDEQISRLLAPYEKLEAIEDLQLSGQSGGGVTQVVKGGAA